LSPPLYFIVSLFDGQHSLLDIQAEYMRKFGEFLYTEKLQEIIGQLDENLFLEGERFQEALRQKEEAFKKASFREAVFAGKSYEADPGRLRTQLEGYFDGTNGPGSLGEKKSAKVFRGEGTVMPSATGKYGTGMLSLVSSSLGQPTPQWKILFA
jgi:hypothetical protein